MNTDLCDDATIQQASALLADATATAAGQLDQLAARWPRDPRLAFMRASMLVTVGRLLEARGAFEATLALAPDFALARYQYGFFLLTSGEVAKALEVWGPLDLLPDGHFLRSVLKGMRALVHDDFDGVRAAFQTAIAANDENEPLNNDLRLLMQRLDSLQTHAPSGAGDDEGAAATVGSAEPELSETSLLFRRPGSGSVH